MPPSRENLLPLPTPTHHSPGTKLSQQQPPPGPTGTKLSQQHPPQGPTSTKLSPHAQKHQNPAISSAQGEFSPASNTTLVPISTQLTGWSPLSPGHQTNAPLSWALCGLSAAHHDVAPERAGTDRRLADWNWPRHPQTSSQQPASRANAIDVRPIIHRLVSNRKLSTGSCAGLECNVQTEHS